MVYQYDAGDELKCEEVAKLVPSMAFGGLYLPAQVTRSIFPSGAQSTRRMTPIRARKLRTNTRVGKEVRETTECPGAPQVGVIIMRPCLVVGRGGRLAHGGIGRWPTKTTLVAWGDGKNKMPFVLVQDVAQAMELALDAPGIEGKAFATSRAMCFFRRENTLLSQQTERSAT